MKTASAKSKGRRLVQALRDKILSTFPELAPDDVRVVPSGCTGEDLWLSPAARRLFGYSVECKMQENISIWACLAQAAAHVECSCDPNALVHTVDCPATNGKPLLVFSRNRSKVYACLELDSLLSLLRRVKP